MMDIQHRIITKQEASIVRTTLQQAPAIDIPQRLFETIESLIVVGKCDCGCASVDFEENGDHSNLIPIGDAQGITEAGGMVGIIVWGTENEITGLEIYDMGAGEKDISLPILESIHPWSKMGAA